MVDSLFKAPLLMKGSNHVRTQGSSLSLSLSFLLILLILFRCTPSPLFSTPIFPHVTPHHHPIPRRVHPHPDNRSRCNGQCNGGNNNKRQRITRRERKTICGHVSTAYSSVKNETRNSYFISRSSAEWHHCISSNLL